MELIEKRREELTKKYTEEKLEEIITKYIDHVSNQMEYMSRESENLKHKINNNGVNAVCVVLSVFKESQNVEAFSRNVKVMIGNLQGANVADERKGDGYIDLEVELPKTKEPSQPDIPPQQPQKVFNPQTKAIILNPQQPRIQQQQQQTQQPQQPEFKRLYSFRVITASINKGVASTLCFGDMVYLRDIKARQYYNKNKQISVAINTGSVEKLTNYTMSDIFYGMYMGDFRNSWLSPNRLSFNELDLSTKLSDEMYILKLKNPSDSADLLIPRSSTAVPDLTNHVLNWQYEDKGKTKHMRFSTKLCVDQWSGQYFGDGLNSRIYVEIRAYQEALGGFYITNPDAWLLFGPIIMQNMDMLSLSQVNVQQTESMELNTKMSSNPGDSSFQKTVGFDYGLVFDTVGILVDAASHYQKIGIPVTADFARQMPNNWVDQNTDVGREKLTRYHKDNLHSRGSNPVVCMFEYAGDVSKIYSDPNITFRVIIATALSDNVMDSIAKLTPSDGEELMRAISTQGGKSKNAAIMDIKARLGSLNYPLQRYLFAIYNNRTFKEPSNTVKMFLEGVGSGAEDEHPDVGTIHPLPAPGQVLQLPAPDVQPPPLENNPVVTNQQPPHQSQQKEEEEIEEEIHKEAHTKKKHKKVHDDEAHVLKKKKRDH